MMEPSVHQQTQPDVSSVEPVCPERGCSYVGEGRCGEHGRYSVAAAQRGVPFVGFALGERYVLESLISSGGMGSVYLGRDLTLRRPIAIKVLQPQLTATKTGRARFVREANALSVLASKYTVRLYDFGVEQDGPLAHLAYMVIEHVPGESLLERIKRDRLSLEDTCLVIDQISEALAEAHTRGIVHRDVKPGNLLLTRGSDGELVCKLIDFGIARVDDGELTNTGVLIGSPQYMAPEQCLGSAQMPIDGRADQYSLAVVAYRLVSGALPFEDREPLRLMAQHLSAPPPNLPGAETDPVLRAINAVLQMALAKAPTHRHADIDAFRRRFVRAARPQDLTAESSGWGESPNARTAPISTAAATHEVAGWPEAPSASAGVPHWVLWAIVGVSALAISLMWVFSNRGPRARSPAPVVVDSSGAPARPARTVRPVGLLVDATVTAPRRDSGSAGEARLADAALAKLVDAGQPEPSDRHVEGPGKRTVEPARPRVKKAPRVRNAPGTKRKRRRSKVPVKRLSTGTPKTTTPAAAVGGRPTREL